MPAKPVQHHLLFPKRPGRPRKDPFDRRGLHGRQGGMFASYDEGPLGNARRAANAVRYVLWNARHHRARGSAPDRASSARWSGAWTTPMIPSGARLAPVFSAETYIILREAMRRFPLERCRPRRGMRVDGVG
jgi:hypothetical protein